MSADAITNSILEALNEVDGIQSPDLPDVAADTDVAETGEAATESETEEATDEAPAVITDVWADIDAKLASDDPEEVRAARDLLHSQRRQIGQRYRAIEKREGKLKTKVQALHADRDVLNTMVTTLRSQGSALRNGDAKGILKTLGDITGMDATELYTQMSLAMATNGKKAPDAELRAELKALREELQTKEQSKAQEQAEQAERQAQAQFLSMTSDDTKFPHLSGFSKTKPAETVAFAIETRDALISRGVEPTFDLIAKAMENEIAASLAALQPAGRTTSAQVAKSEPSRSAQPTKSMSPKARERAAVSGQTRPKTEAERFADLAQDKSIWARIGIPGM